jgi:NADPH:quinone reductase-like Zn-dependent oxidoreductase
MIMYFILTVVAVWNLGAILLASPVASTSANRSVWSTGYGGLYVNEYAYAPRAVFPGTAVVRVRFASINPMDYKALDKLAALPFIRWIAPLAFLHDFSGVVQEVNECSGFQRGDEVFGLAIGGSLAQYTVVTCQSMARKPAQLSFEKAGAAPAAAVTAYKCLHDLKKGAHVLVLGSAGGCGSYGVLLAKSMGAARVSCVASGKNRALSVDRLGCDEFFDYTSPTFVKDMHAKMQGKVDLIYDTVSSMVVSVDYYDDVQGLLKNESGVICALGPTIADLPLVGSTRNNRIRLQGNLNCSVLDVVAKKHLSVLTEGLVSEVVDAFNMTALHKAIEVAQSGRTQGKIVVRVE